MKNLFYITLFLIGSQSFAGGSLGANNCLLDYQAFFSGDMYINASDIQGDVFVGGSSFLTNFEINGDLKSVKKVEARSGSIKGEVQASKFKFEYVGLNGRRKNHKLGDTSSELQRQMVELSNKLSKIEADIAIHRDDKTIRIDVPSGDHVVNLAPSDIHNNYKFEFNGEPDSILIINIFNPENSDIFFVNKVLSYNGLSADQIIFNFPDTESLSIARVGPGYYEYGTGLLGTVLAPNASLKFWLGVIDGGVYAKELVDMIPTGQIDPVLFRDRSLFGICY